MALSEGDKAECKEIAREIVKEVLIEHSRSCIHGQALALLKARAVGIAVGIGLASGGSVVGLVKLFGI